MPDIGAAALQGIEEQIEEKHTFEVDNQTRVIANGLAIWIFEPGSDNSEWYGTDTTPDGKPVSKGYKVTVWKAKVKFKI